MTTILITGPDHSGKTSLFVGLLAWLRGAGRTATLQAILAGWRG